MVSASLVTQLILSLVGSSSLFRRNPVSYVFLVELQLIYILLALEVRFIIALVGQELVFVLGTVGLPRWRLAFAHDVLYLVLQLFVSDLDVLVLVLL